MMSASIYTACALAVVSAVLGMFSERQKVSLGWTIVSLVSALYAVVGYFALIAFSM